MNLSFLGQKCFLGLKRKIFFKEIRRSRKFKLNSGFATEIQVYVGIEEFNRKMWKISYGKIMKVEKINENLCFSDTFFVHKPEMLPINENSTKLIAKFLKIPKDDKFEKVP